MTARILDGKSIAMQIRQEVAELTAKRAAQTGQQPCLAAILVGDDPASQVYVRNKERACEKAGIRSRLIRLPATTTQQELAEQIDQLNREDEVHGILLQLPLPVGLDPQPLLDSISPEKDVDGFHPTNVGRLSQGRQTFLPCTPHGIIQLLARCDLPTVGKEVVVVGRSDIVGKPMAMLLAQKSGPCGPRFANATVTLAHSQTADLSEVTRRADILIAAIGKPCFIKGEMIRPGAVVIDVGINRVDEKLVGDVDFAAACQVASAITPVPGGIGPLTVAMLLMNVVRGSHWE